MKNVAISIRARLLAYPPETVVAEKIEAAVTLGIGNTRMKDFYDLTWLSNHQIFSGDLLGRAIVATFARRDTEMPTALPFALTAEFGEDPAKVTQWNAFIRKGKLDAPSLPKVIERIRNFLAPVILERHVSIAKTWHPETGWTEKSS